MPKTRSQTSPLRSSYAHHLQRLRDKLHAVLDQTLPEQCAACRTVSSSHLLCACCCSNQDSFRHHTSLEVGSEEVPAYSAFAYTEQVRSAVHRLKFEGHPELARRAGRAMYDALPQELRTPLWWVPVPLERTQLVARGFNQSALLANELAQQANGRSSPMLLQRNPGASKQSHLSRAERRTNLAAAFDLNVTQRPLAVGSCVVLVDDVLTTGATAMACCKVLRDCGYRVAAVVTLARVTGHQAAPLANAQ